jgi:hypothetical protein
MHPEGRKEGFFLKKEAKTFLTLPALPRPILAEGG